MAVYESERKIYYTRDYDMFKTIKGNRLVDPKRKAALIKSITVNGWLCNPIMVNEHYQIIDGQGRFEALKALEMPIEFVIQDGASIVEVVALNVNAKNWTLEDYIDCYADLEIRDYISLRQTMDLYIDRNKAMSLNGILTVLNIIDKRSAQPGSGGIAIKNGTYFLTEETAETSYYILEWLRRYSEFLKLISPARRPQLIRSLAFALHCSTADEEQLGKTLNRLTDEGKRIGADNLNACLDYVSDEYNKRLPQRLPRVYLRKEYDDWSINKKGESK